MITRMSNLEDFTIRTGDNSAVKVPAGSNGIVALTQHVIQLKTQDAPAGSGKGTIGGMRVKPRLFAQLNGRGLADSDRLMSISTKSGPDGQIVGHQNIYAYICDNNNQNYDNVIVGKSLAFNWPSQYSIPVLISFGEDGVELNQDVAYNILLSQSDREIGETLSTSELKTIRVPMCPAGVNTDDFCCLSTSFSTFRNYQLEMQFSFARTTDSALDVTVDGLSALEKALVGRSFDVTSNTDVQKAIGAIITALGGTATNVPS